jgi:hypothetical protein
MSLVCTILALMAAAAPAPVQTHRSDGAVPAAVRQVLPKERRRAARIVRSTGALPARGAWRDRIEPVSGGARVAPADDGPAGGPEPLIVVRPARGLPPGVPQR